MRVYTEREQILLGKGRLEIGAIRGKLAIHGAQYDSDETIQGILGQCVGARVALVGPETRQMNQLLQKSIEMARVKKRFQEWRRFCRSCGVAQTSADREAGRCTNCGK